MVDILRKAFRSAYYTLYGSSGKNIKINNEDYTVSAHVARGITSTIDEVPLKLLSNMAVNASVLFDVGGNIGVIATILAKKMKKGTTIYSFEPAPLSFKYLADTARVQKGNAKIIPVNLAVSNNNDKLYFTNDGNSCTNHIATGEEANTISIDCITIDAYCTNNKVVPQVMKVDIEGAEFWALEGMQQTLRNNNVMVLVEIHQGYLAEHNITGDMFGTIIGNIGYRAFTATGKEIPGNEVIKHSCVILSKEKVPDAIFNI
jgi:FkbM family methyltransferase